MTKIIKSNTKSKIIILITLVILFTLSPSITKNLSSIGSINNSRDYGHAINLDKKNLKISVLPEPIFIDDNWSAAKAAGICTGEGTYSNPYVIKDLVIEGNHSGSGIQISHSTVYFKIENCTIYKFSNGILLYYASNGILFENNFSNNTFGIHIKRADNNTVIGNIADSNSNSGIFLDNSSNHLISGNIADGNSKRGIFLDNSSNHLISGNIISRNVEIGIHIQDSTNNSIYENFFIDNGLENAWDDELSNHWDNGMIGNYWSDYSGIDANDDGIGDTPYDIPGVEGVQDNFPIWDDGPDLQIPGYNLLFFLGILSVVVIILSKKLRKSKF